MNTNHFLPAEWHPQSFIQLTWPHAGTDWAYMLDDVEACFVNLANEIASRQPLLLVAPDFPKHWKAVRIRTTSIFDGLPYQRIPGHATTDSSPY